jgi:hypothetical protein
MGFRPMKKNDILRVRVDAPTLEALQRACADSGCSLSEILRDGIVHELARRNGNSKAPDANKPEKSITLAAGNEREACAWLLSSILVGRSPRPKERAERWRGRQRRVTHLLESLFRAICIPPEEILPDAAHPVIAHSAILGTESEPIMERAPASISDNAGL